MKKSLIAISLFVMMGITSSYAQKAVKLGYINSAELFQMMPGKDGVEAKLGELRSSLEQTVKTMYEEYQSKAQDYQANVATMSQIIKQTKEREIQDLEGRIQEFQQTADNEYKQKQAELYNPLIEKAKKAIDEVSKENGYTYIFDTSTGAVLFFENGDNILPLVKEKIGI